LLVLQGAQMLVDDRDRIGQKLRGGLAVSVLLCGELPLVIAQLIQQTIAQVAACDSGRVHLANQIEGLVQISQVEAGLKDGLGRFSRSKGLRRWRGRENRGNGFWSRCERSSLNSGGN